MKRTILSGIFATAVALLASTQTAHAICQWGNWSSIVNVQGSFGQNFSECSSPGSWAGVFRAHSWITGCQLGLGCTQNDIQRVNGPAIQCSLPGIGMRVRGNVLNIVTGVPTNNVLGRLISPNSSCNLVEVSDPPANSRWTTTQCRIAWGCP